MLVLYKPCPQSILKAFMASRLHKAKPVEDIPGTRFYFEDTIDVDKLDYDSIYSQYKESFGGLDFLEDEKLWEKFKSKIQKDINSEIIGLIKKEVENGKK